MGGNTWTSNAGYSFLAMVPLFHILLWPSPVGVGRGKSFPGNPKELPCPERAGLEPPLQFSKVECVGDRPTPEVPCRHRHVVLAWIL